MLRVERQDRLHHLDLVAQALDERRPQRAVDQAAGQDGVLAGPALTAEERTGNAPGRVHPLLDVDGQREEVELLLGVLAGRGGRQDDGVAQLGQHATGGLLGQPSRAEGDLTGTECPVVDHGSAVVRAQSCLLGHGQCVSLVTGTPRGALRRGRSFDRSPRAGPPRRDGCVAGWASRWPLPRTDWCRRLRSAYLMRCLPNVCAREGRALFHCASGEAPRCRRTRSGSPRLRYRRRPSLSAMARRRAMSVLAR